MNVRALFVILTSVLVAGILTSTNPDDDGDGVVIKHGHRVVVVEYENDEPATKISISPQEIPKQDHHLLSSINPKELVCDAYGKCRHAFSAVVEKAKSGAKDKVPDAVDNDSAVSSKASEMNDQVEEKAEETVKAVKKQGKKELRHLLQRGRELAVDIYEYVAQGTDSFTAAMSLMGFSAAYGMCIWITFASSYVLAKALPRQQFAQVHMKIYPVYFKAMGYSVGLALFGHLMNQRIRNKIQGYNLVASIGMIMGNLLFFEPLATKAMMETLRKEKEASNGETAGKVSRSQVMKQSEDLRKLNTYSSALNVVTLVSLSWYLVYLAQQLNCCHGPTNHYQIS